MKKATIALLLICGVVFAQQKGSFNDTRDKKTYKTVKIGEQVWMAENLNYDAKGSKCYNNKPANCQKYGRLYEWNTAKEACPSGWHLPNDKEWEELSNLTGHSSIYGVGTKLQAKNGWLGIKGTDEFGFSALPSGYGRSYGGFNYNYAEVLGVWWVTSERGASYIPIYYDYEFNNWGGDVDSDLFSVRCLQGQAQSTAVNVSSNEQQEEIADAKAAVKEVPVQRGSFSDQRDGKTYKTVKIGSQTWMAENLNYDAKGSKFWMAGASKSNSLFNKQKIDEKYGRFYNWETAMKACPKGWHLPSHEEWIKLINYVGGLNAAGKKLKATSDWNYGSYNGNGTDEFGFSALPAGSGYPTGQHTGFNMLGGWWSSTEFNAKTAYTCVMGVDRDSVECSEGDKVLYPSVRCVQD